MEKNPFRSIRDFETQIDKSTNIAIITHQTPDADAICSMVALRKLIHLNNKTGNVKHIDIFADTDIIEEQFIPIINGDPFNVQRFENYDLVIGVDCPNANRFGKYKYLFENHNNTVNIDHHETNEDFAHNNLIIKTSSSAEVIYILYSALKKEISDNICKVIYGGVITDTANLTHGTFTASTYKFVAELKRRGIDIDSVNEHFMKNNSKSKNLLLAKAIKSLKFTARDQVAIMRLTKSDFTNVDATFSDSVGIINHAIAIKGVKIAMIMIKKEDNSYYISLRGKCGVNVAEIAKVFGGGGHENAAAFNYSGTVAELNPQFVKICNEQLKKCDESSESIFFDNNDLKEPEISDEFDIQ